MAKRSSDHLISQRKIKEAEGYVCTICWTNAPEKAEGHHIIEYSVDGPAGLRNFTTLCRDCHAKYHAGNMNVDIESF
jgi:5-methylcytosine-specific restriction endonuclease McrA